MLERHIALTYTAGSVYVPGGPVVSVTTGGTDGTLELRAQNLLNQLDR